MQTVKIMTIIVVGIFCVSLIPVSLAVTNPNYGTTTFFSGKTEKPVLERPILGAGDSPDNSDNDDDNNDSDDDGDENGGGIVNPNDIFIKLGDTLNSVVDNSVAVFNGTRKSLFDMQSDFGSSGTSGNDEFEKKDEFFIAGPRGESPEYMASLGQEGARTLDFNFEDRSLRVVPKKSNFLFTNKEVTIDMTSQYVIITLIFIIAIGTAVGYYYVKKRTFKGKEEKYD